jgi:AhpD family alkylhydroperoxidase
MVSSAQRDSWADSPSVAASVNVASGSKGNSYRVAANTAPVLNAVVSCAENDEKMNRKAKEFMNDVLEGRGYVYPFQEFYFMADPELAKAEWAWYKLVRAKKSLPLKYKELLIVMSSLVKGHERGLRTHMKKALELGATKEEIVETIQVASMTSGLGATMAGMTILMEVLGHTISREPEWKKEH